MRLPDSRPVGNEPLSASNMIPRESAVYDQSGDSSLGIPTDSMNGWGQHESGQTLPMASSQAMSAANELDAPSWSGFHLRNDPPGVLFDSDAGYSMIPTEVSETTRSWGASNNSFSFLDDTSMSASFSASATKDKDSADARTLDQSILTACPENAVYPWRDSWNHVDLEGRDGQQESVLPDYSLCDEVYELSDERKWVNLEYVQEE
jgi:hypothetical protein